MSNPLTGAHRGDSTLEVVHETGGIVAVSLRGEFDLANAPEVASCLERALPAGTDAVLDLGESTFVDSHVIRVLVQAIRRVQAGGGAIVVQTSPATIVHRALEIVGLTDALPLAATRSEAVALIRHGSRERPQLEDVPRSARRHAETETTAV